MKENAAHNSVYKQPFAMLVLLIHLRWQPLMIMIKKLLYSLLFAFFLFMIFTLWISPSLGGLIPGGKSTHDKSVGVLAFDTVKTGIPSLTYNTVAQDPKLVKLRQEFGLDSIVNSTDSDYEKVLLIQSWVQSRWLHNGDSMPEKSDAYYILTEAKKGRRFRCVEYSIVAAECLRSLGFTVRSLGLMTKDIDEVNYGAGHVVNEVYIKDLEKWVFIDPQYDIIVTREGIPLNAVEFQNAIANKQEIEIINPNKVIAKQDYIDWIGPYLYYFTANLNKGNIGIWDRIIGTKKQITLVPKGAKPPKYFQRLFRINNSYFTNSVNDFYPIP
jgi:hypothetical protein